MIRSMLTVLTLALLLSSCAVTVPSDRTGVRCETATFAVADNFDGARWGCCTVLADDHVSVTILPEDDGTINDSAWYAFKILPNHGANAKITLNYFGGHHRYIPKLSSDGLHWTPLDTSRVEVSEDGKQATLSVPMSGKSLWVASQELITPAMYDVWNAAMISRTDASRSTLGLSKGGRAIDMLTTESPSSDVLFLVGRQHPAEVTGAFAFFSFYETLLADSDLAKRFRNRFDIVAIPMMNPDGIVNGHWRHNLAGTDLNRDWGPFEQPETQSVRDLLNQLDAQEKSIRVFLDFHSTKRNVFYSQDEENVTKPPNFTNMWLRNAEQRIENYAFTNQENDTERPGVAKNYIYRRYGIPASTYEVGDETDRDATRAAAAVLAEELMQLMLQQEYQ